MNSSSESWRAWPAGAKRKLLERLRQIETPAADNDGWSPLPDRDGIPSPQRLAYESLADVTGYGGAGGGGKSELLLGLALTRHRRSIIFRREATQLKALIDRARELLGDAGRFNENTGIWRNLPGGRQLEFGGCKDKGDEQKYRGRPHDMVGFDEADAFTEFQFRFLTGWVRTTVPNQRCRVALTFNPPSTVEGQWILRYFAPWIDPKHPRPAKPGELRWYARVDDQDVERPDGSPFEHQGKINQPQSRTFIPARLADNPHLAATGYAAVLQSLPEPLRSQLLEGDFTAGLQDDARQVIPTAWVQQAQARWRPGGGQGVPLSALGVDVARGGMDQTILAPRHKTWFGPLQKHPGRATPDGPSVAALVVRQLLAPCDKYAMVNLDVIGWGSSAYDFCRGQVVNLNPINFAEGTDNRDKSGQLAFANLRAWAHRHLREALDPSVPPEDQLALPPDPELLADLTAVRWSIGPNGIRLEPKEDVAARLGRSPDCGDGVVLAALPTIPLIVGLPGKDQGSVIARAPAGVFAGKMPGRF